MKNMGIRIAAVLIIVVLEAAFISGCQKGKEENKEIIEIEKANEIQNETNGEIKKADVKSSGIDVDSDTGNAEVLNEVQDRILADEILVDEIVDESDDIAGDNDMDVVQGFYISEIDDELFDSMYGKSYKEDSTILREELRYVHVLHIGFDGKTHEGELVCNKAIADDIIDIFTKLYENQYEIEKIRLIDEYDADDESSMADNNSSCFNFRFISHTTTVSNHGRGIAIDINPLYNPYVKTVNGKLNIEPSNSVQYVDRSLDFEHKIDENDLAYKLFTEHGFTWGGAWKNSKDYQHFEKEL